MHEITRHPEVPVDRRAAHPNGTRGVRSRRRRRAGVGAVLGLFVLGLLGSQTGAPAVAHSGHDDDDHGSFAQTNLVSDIPGLAKLTDPAVINPWGIAFGPTTPLWVNNQGSQTPGGPSEIQLYEGANGHTKFTKRNLVIHASSPTAMVFNGDDSSFLIDQGEGRVAARFMFAELFLGAGGEEGLPDGKITGWAGSNPAHTTTTPTGIEKPASLPFGLALVPRTTHRGARLLVADTANGVIDVYNSRFRQIDRPGLFVDPEAKAEGLAPYNVTFLKGRVYVAYVGASEGDPGAVSVFGPGGRFIRRLITSTRLVGPWGMAIAPERWGRFGGRLLVGNVDDGMINAFDRRDGRFSGTLRDAEGEPLVNLGLWGIAFGNGVIGTPRTLIFAAGIGEEVGQFEGFYEHGLIGLIKPVRHHDEDDDDD